MYLLGVRPSSLRRWPSLLKTTSGARVESMQLAWVSREYLDGDHPLASVLEEVLAVDAHDAGLVRLSDVCEDEVDHLDEVSIVLRLAGVHDDGDHVGASLGHVQQFSAAAGRELDGVEDACGADDVRDVRASRPRRRAEVEHLAAWSEVEGVDTACNCCCDL